MSTKQEPYYVYADANASTIHIHPQEIETEMDFLGKSIHPDKKLSGAMLVQIKHPKKIGWSFIDHT